MIVRSRQMTKRFSDKYIQSIKPEAKKKLIREGRGFTLQVMPSGVKTFLYIYTFNGERKNVYLGKYPFVTLAEARVKYNEAYNKVQAGANPGEEHKKEQKTAEEDPASFGYFATQYMKWSSMNHALAWFKTVRLSLKNDVLPAWRNRPIAEIRRRDAIELLERVAARAPGQAKNVHKVARAVFEYAIECDYLEANPMLKLSRIIPALKPVIKKRILSDSEIRHVWHALEDGSGDERTKAAIKLVLVTAQRPGEVAGMHRSQIEGSWWTLESTETKNEEAHRIYLTPTALKLIGDAEGYIFASDKPTDAGGPRSKVRQTLSQHIAIRKYFNLPTWTPHDLRRTARTVMARLGVPEEHAEAILNHKKQGIVKVYNLHQYNNEKKAAMLLWEAELIRIIGDGGGGDHG
jgi:integrase